jgi:hypothetical protein
MDDADLSLDVEVGAGPGSATLNGGEQEDAATVTNRRRYRRRWI